MILQATFYLFIKTSLFHWQENLLKKEKDLNEYKKKPVLDEKHLIKALF